MTRKILKLTVLCSLPLMPGAAFALEGDEVWRADLAPINSQVANNHTSGTVKIARAADLLQLRVDAIGTPPNTIHLQHTHGFTVGRENAACPSASADTNRDGFIDIKETEAVAGVSMIPFHANPMSFDLLGDGYPASNADGAFTYDQTIVLSDIRDAFEAKYPGQLLDIEKRVFFVHGVPDNTLLPDSVQSLGNVPAQLTLPIACGSFREDLSVD